MAPTFKALSGINFPAPSVLGFLEALETQLNLKYADSGGEILGTLTASKRPVKPFIVGFIPPDNPVNFVPTSPALSVLADIGGPASGPKSVSTSKRVSSGNDGELERVNARVFVDELRQKVFDEYQSQTGVTPSEESLRLIVSHIVAENGPAYGNPPSFPTFNFNLGNSHASKEGTYTPEASSRAIRKGVDPTFGIATYPPRPNGGTYYLGTDYDGGNRAYPVYFTAFTSLDSAVAYQVNLLVRGYPKAAVALTEEEYIDGLLNQPGRAPYFEANPIYYEGVLKARGAEYDKRYSDSPLGIVSGPISPPGTEEVTRTIMKSGVNPNDPLSSALGRPVQLADATQQRIVANQVKALQRQIRAVQSVPPLVLLVNPKTFNRSYENSSDTGVKGRYGQIVHTWLERPFTIDASGVTAGQYAVDTEGSGGLTNVNRIHSLSYKNLLSLVGIYKNNGSLLSGTEADKGIPILGMSVFIYYDEHVYLGSFDSFNVDDTADKPYNMAYNFKFSVRYDLPTNGAVSDYSISSNLRF